MDEEKNPMEASCDIEFVRRDPKVDIRVGDEYQVAVPPMMSESERVALLLNPLDSDSTCSFVVGLPVEVMWIDTKYRDGHGLGDDNVDMNESLRSLKTKRSTQQRMNLQSVPGISSSSWEDLEVDGFVLGLYTFGKDFTEVKKLLGSKEIGELLSFYYGKFYKTDRYKIWYNSLKKRSSRRIQGKKLYSGWRLQQLLSRLIPGIPDEQKKQMLVNASKSFSEKDTSLEEYISEVKELVGLRSLVKAVAIGKGKEDLTVLTTEPAKSKQWFTISSVLGDYSKLTSDEIVKKLTGGTRLSKARRNDLFWEAVWPRLLARGWSSEQPKDRCYNKSWEHIVFLVPGVKKFSRRDLVKQDHYFDSISDILAKVVSEPELIEFETSEIRVPNRFMEENIRDQSNKEKRRYLRCPDSSSTHTKFTVVDTSSFASEGKLCEWRELKNPNAESLVSKPKNSYVERSRRMPPEIQKRAKFDDDCSWERRRKKQLIDDQVRYMIVDTSVDHGAESSGIRRRRYLPGNDENLLKMNKSIKREATGDSSQNQSGTYTDRSYEYPEGANTVAKEENVQQGWSKKRLSQKSESRHHHSLTSLPLPKRRRLSDCVRKDIKCFGESSVLKAPAPVSVDLKTEQIEETGNGISLYVELEERSETEPKRLCPISETVHEPNGFCSISVLDEQCCSKEQKARHELSSSKESDRLCLDEKLFSKDLKAAQQQGKAIQVRPMLASDTEKSSPSTQEEEENQQTNADIPRRQSTRKRPLTTRALEALESGFLTTESIKSTSKPRSRTKIKQTSNASNRAQGESDSGFLVKEATASKRLDEIEDSKKVTREFPKLPPIVLKLPLKRS